MLYEVITRVAVQQLHQSINRITCYNRRLFMKRTILLVSLLLAAGLLMAALQGCKGPEGPAGPAGESKILQLEGFAADINCGDCHNPDTVITSYSIHYTKLYDTRHKDTDCARSRRHSSVWTIPTGTSLPRQNTLSPCPGCGNRRS